MVIDDNRRSSPEKQQNRATFFGMHLAYLTLEVGATLSEVQTT